MIMHLLQQLADGFFRAMSRWRQAQVERDLESRYGPDWLEKLTR